MWTLFLVGLAFWPIENGVDLCETKVPGLRSVEEGWDAVVSALVGR